MGRTKRLSKAVLFFRGVIEQRVLQACFFAKPADFFVFPEDVSASREFLKSNALNK
jgi:hypothetical protein